MNRPLSTILALLFTAGCGAAAGAGPERPAVVFTDNCGSCHGPNGLGNKAFNAPSIAGLPYWYVRAQLHKFRDGARGAHPDDIDGLRMRPMARTLLEEDVKTVAAYVARMQPKTDLHPVSDGDVEHGKALYLTCTACHGADGEGNETLNAPPIVRLDPWYAEAQLDKFKNDIRGADRPGQPEDITGKQMAPMAKLLTGDHDVQDLLAYIATLPHNK